MKKLKTLSVRNKRVPLGGNEIIIFYRRAIG